MNQVNKNYAFTPLTKLKEQKETKTNKRIKFNPTSDMLPLHSVYKEQRKIVASRVIYKNCGEVR